MTPLPPHYHRKDWPRLVKGQIQNLQSRVDGLEAGGVGTGGNTNSVGFDMGNASGPNGSSLDMGNAV